MSAVYRVRQFARAAGAWLRPDAAGQEQPSEPALDRYLPAAGLTLFGVMPGYDRAHALAVFDSLRREGHANPDLLAAALLHDAGKTAHPIGRLYLWHRVAAVLVRAWRPGLLERIGRKRAAGWRRAFFVQVHHADLSAELAREAGCSERTVALILHHEDPPGAGDDPLLAALQAADSQN